MIIVNGIKKEENLIMLDAGYTFGKGLFETILINNKAIFLEEHLKRLNKGLAQIKINKKIESKYVTDIIQKFNLYNCALKIMVSDDNIIFSTREVPYTEKNYIEGFNLKISSIKRNVYSHLTYIKSFNYMDNIIEREIYLPQGYDEVLFLNIYDKVSEGSVSNIFFVKDNVLNTPKVECGLLGGIIRQWVINNFKTIEGTFVVDDLLHADEVFITNSLIGIMKVSCLENIKLKENRKYIDEINLKYKKEIHPNSGG